MPIHLASLKYAFAGMVAWALWAVFVKLALRGATTQMVLLITYATAAFVIAGYVALTGGELDPTRWGLGYSLAGGAASGLGALAYYRSLETGDVGTTTTITGLYFVVAAILGALVLDESLSASDTAGIALAALGVAILVR
ncbi:EamA family transporter [Natrialbaceae archaeon GCM10025810]|uniref:EamA family transporter n=1 Tax=Halovalidus salilacus TaxID=3075124 RepID=UPI00360A292F